MGLVDYMGALTDSNRRITSSRVRSRTRSGLLELDAQFQGSSKRPRTIPHQGLGLGLGSVVHLSAGAVDLRGFVSNCENNSAVRILSLLPAPSPLKRKVQGPQRPDMPKRSPSAAVTQFTPVRSSNTRIELEPEPQPERELELELDNEWSRPVRYYQSPANLETLESYKRRVANLQRAFAYVHRECHQGHPRRHGREHENRPSSSPGVIVPVSPPVKEKPLYKTLYENAKGHDFKLKGLALEIELATVKFEALQIVKKEIKSESQIQNQVEAEEGQLGGDQEQYEEDEKELLVALHDVFAPLSDDDESDVARALKNLNRSEELVMHESSNIQITREILQCLLPNGWLNDEVINLYLELLKEREKREPNKYLKCHFFNTFFYKKLYSSMARYDYKAVRRWTTQKKIGYGLTDCDKIFVPIHKEIHWCLAIIDMRAKKFQYLDSLKGTDGHVLQVLARYIADEARDKTGQDLDVSAWDQEVVEDIPEQENGWDCGMFMIKYADFHSRDLPLIFGQEHMPYFRKRTAKEILRLRAE